MTDHKGEFIVAAGIIDDALGQRDLQQRLDSATPGSVMPLPVATYVSPEGGFVQTRDLSWRLEPDAEIRGDDPAGDGESLLTVRMDGYGRQGDFRGGFLTGGRFLVSHPDDGPGRAEPSARLGRGGYAIDIRATGPGLNILNYRISQASVSGSTGAVRFIGAGFGQTVAWSGLRPFDHADAWRLSPEAGVLGQPLLLMHLAIHAGAGLHNLTLLRLVELQMVIAQRTTRWRVTTLPAWKRSNSI